MKKFILILMTAAMLLTCISCSNAEGDDTTAAQTQTAADTDSQTTGTGAEDADTTVADTVADTTAADTITADTTVADTTVAETTAAGVQISTDEVKEMSNLILNGHNYELSGDGLFSTDYSKFQLSDVVSFIRLYGSETFLKQYMRQEDIGLASTVPAFTISADKLKSIAKDVFGCDYDFTTLGAKQDEYDGLYYDKAAGNVEYVMMGGAGGSVEGYEYNSHVNNGDGTLTVNVDHVEYDYSDGSTTVLGTAVLKLELQDSGIWQIVSMKKN